MELYEDQGRGKGQEGFIVLEEYDTSPPPNPFHSTSTYQYLLTGLSRFANQAIKDAFNVKPSHVAASTKVREEELIRDFKIGCYKHVFGVGKMIGGHESGEKVLMAVFVTVNEGKMEEVS